MPQLIRPWDAAVRAWKRRRTVEPNPLCSVGTGAAGLCTSSSKLFTLHPAVDSWRLLYFLVFMRTRKRLQLPTVLKSFLLIMEESGKAKNSLPAYHSLHTGNLCHLIHSGWESITISVSQEYIPWETLFYQPYLQYIKTKLPRDKCAPYWTQKHLD